MESQKAMRTTIISVLILLLPATSTAAVIDCATVTGLVSACSTFIIYGSPDPTPGSPCCDAMVSLNNVVDSTDNRRSVCRCMMGLISTYNPNASAIAALTGFCGISLGFSINPNIDCNNIP